MARILTIDLERAQGVRTLVVWRSKRHYGGVVPGIYAILAGALQIALPSGWLYKYLHLRPGSPLTHLQRELLATVVNGLVGGAP